MSRLICGSGTLLAIVAKDINVGLALSCLGLPLKIKTLTGIVGPDRNFLANSYEFLIFIER